jgi:hypothetical protein
MYEAQWEIDHQKCLRGSLQTVMLPSSSASKLHCIQSRATFSEAASRVGGMEELGGS